MEGPSVSIIILTKNEEKSIGKCLECIHKQTYKDYEVIIVDANSTDNTVKIAESYGARIVKEEDGKGFGYARNLGVRNARGNMIVFVDADVFLIDNTILERALKKLEETKADIVLGGLRYPRTPLGAYLEMWHPKRPGKGFMPHNRLLIARKKVLELFPYDEWFVEGAEDLDLFYRLLRTGVKILYDPGIWGFHNTGYYIEEWYSKMYRYGYALAKFHKKYKMKSWHSTLLYPILSPIYMLYLGIRKIGPDALKLIRMLNWIYLMEKERWRGYIDGLKYA